MVKKTLDKPSRSAPKEASSVSITKQMIDEINGLNNLEDYGIRTLVGHAEAFGPFLRNRRLETNQIRKFLDAINRLKAQLAGDPRALEEEALSEEEKTRRDAELFAKIESDIILLKPKLAYAAARQDAAEPLSDVMSAAINKTYTLKDFERLVQMIESVIAYHKAAGGR